MVVMTQEMVPETRKIHHRKKRTVQENQSTQSLTWKTTGSPHQHQHKMDQH